MRLPDEVQKCVVFFGKVVTDPKTNTAKERLGGTGFFVQIGTDIGVTAVCLVTAAHVARQLNHGDFFVRANTKDGKSKQYKLVSGVNARWIFHPSDDSVDAAVLLWKIPQEVDFLCIPEVMFLPQEKLDAKDIGVGDETYVTGLFRFHTGRSRNEPIVRSGHIAMIPKERIPVPLWHIDGIEGYLIEGRSIGGFSGAPVFVQRSIKVQPIETSGRPPLAAGAIFWLGLMHGHWNITDSKVDSVNSDIYPNVGDPEVKINAGISIVVPCYKILEVLHQDSIRAAISDAINKLIDLRSELLDGGSPAYVKADSKTQATDFITDVASASKYLPHSIVAYPVSAKKADPDDTDV